jgi:BirA family biotin operon repressor/biotin-[acetyl-CoA-carboxylase] ligase
MRDHESVATSPYTDLNRPPLHESALRRALLRPNGVWSALRVVDQTGSTNADLVAQARAGAPDGTVLVAEQQGAGRGRLDRTWSAPARSAITMSMLLRPGDKVAPGRLGWLGLLAGVALAQEVRRLGLVDAVLKWPNDLLVRSDGPGDRYGKCAGILAEVADDAVVIGIGLNVHQRLDELPPPPDPDAYPPVSLALVAAACTDRDPLVRAILRHLETWYGQFLAAGGDPDACGLREAYRGLCQTLGQTVGVAVQGGRVIRGLARDVDLDGQLVIDTETGPRRLAAGDILRVR